LEFIIEINNKLIKHPFNLDYLIIPYNYENNKNKSIYVIIQEPEKP
jgi:hypothetical protein